MIYSLVKIYNIFGTIYYKLLEISSNKDYLSKKRDELELKTFKKDELAHKYNFLVFELKQ